jgi:hypothetical protein
MKPISRENNGRKGIKKILKKDTGERRKSKNNIWRRRKRCRVGHSAIPMVPMNSSCLFSLIKTSKINSLIKNKYLPVMASFIHP